MNAKKILVSLCTIAIALFVLATVSAAPLYGYNLTSGSVFNVTTSDIAYNTVMEIDGLNVLENPSVIAGDTVTVKVVFSAENDATDVRVKAELEGDKASVTAVSESFDIEQDNRYQQSLTLKVPFELKDDLSDFITLNVKIWNGDFESEYQNILVKVQRPSYNPVVKSISTSQSVDAGETFPVDVVLKNLGYDELEDLYVTVGIPDLNVKKTVYFGDLVAIENNTNDDDEETDTVSGRLYLEVPYTAKSGVYTLQVEVANDDVIYDVAKQIVVNNDFPGNVVVTSADKTVAVGEDAEYTLLLVNPTNSLKLYRVIAESNGEVSSSVDSAVVAVPAGTSKTVKVTANARTPGEYNFKVNVLSGETLDSQVNLKLTAEEKAVNPIVVLTVILAIIFLVLLVVLIVLLGKKPQKSEEFGESYY